MAVITPPNYPYSATPADNAVFTGNAPVSQVDEFLRLLASASSTPFSRLFDNDRAINTQLEALPDLLSGQKFEINAVAAQSVITGSLVWFSDASGINVTASSPVPVDRFPQGVATEAASAGRPGTFTQLGVIRVDALTGFSRTNTQVYMDFVEGSWVLTTVQTASAIRVGTAAESGSMIQLFLNFVNTHIPQRRIATLDEIADAVPGVIVDAQGFSTRLEGRIDDVVDSLTNSVEDAVDREVQTWARTGNEEDLPATKIPFLPASRINSGRLEQDRIPRFAWKPLDSTQTNPVLFTPPQGVSEYLLHVRFGNNPDRVYPLHIPVDIPATSFSLEGSSVQGNFDYSPGTIALRASGVGTNSVRIRQMYWR